MDKKKILKIVEIVFICLIFFLSLKYSVSFILQNQIIHEYPTGYFADDNFGRLACSLVVSETGGYRHVPYYQGEGYSNVLPYCSPSNPILTGFLSFASGIEFYNILAFFMGICLSLIVLINFLIIRKYNVNLAYLATILFPFLFYQKFYLLILWGQYGVLAGHFGLILFFWLLTDFSKFKYLIPFVMAATFIAHPPEFIFEVLFLGFFFLVSSYDENRFKLLKKIFLIGIATLVLIGEYLIVFYYKTIKGDSGQTLIQFITAEEGWWGPIKYDFPSFFLILILIGIFINLFLIKKKREYVFMYSIFMLIISYGNYFALGGRAFQVRYFWPVYLGIFLALPIFQVFKLIPKKIKDFTIPLFSMIVIILLFSFLITPVTSTGLMTKEHWDSYEWLEENTPENANVLFYYSDFYDQDRQLFLVKRMSFYLHEDRHFFEKVGNNDYTNNFIFAGMYHGKMLPFEKSFFNYGFHRPKGDSETISLNICDYEYHVFDKFSSKYEQINKYNLELMNRLNSKDWIDLVYQNNQVVIFKNKNLGEECV